MKLRRYWTDDEVAYLREHYPHRVTWAIAAEMGRDEKSLHQKANDIGLRKTAAFLRSDWHGNLNLTEGGKPHRFQNGNVPHNKGVAGWQSGGRSAQTRFKPGNLPQTWRPVGSTRVTREGIMQVKVTDTRCSRRDYRCVHVMVWEAYNGPVPDGQVVVFKNGDRFDFRPDNLECITRAELMRRNSIHNLPPALVDTYRALAVLHRAIRGKRGKHGDEHD